MYDVPTPSCSSYPWLFFGVAVLLQYPRRFNHHHVSCVGVIDQSTPGEATESSILLFGACSIGRYGRYLQPGEEIDIPDVLVPSNRF